MVEVGYGRGRVGSELSQLGSRRFVQGADNSFYRPTLAILTVTDQNDSRHNVKTVLPIINTLILLENDQQLLSH